MYFSTNTVPTSLLFVFLVANFVGFSSSSSWSYDDDLGNGPSAWATDYSSYCAGDSQSPIDIDTGDLVEDTTLANLTFAFSATVDWNELEVSNNGHSVAFKKSDNADYPVTVSGGGLGHTYTMRVFHFHWGSSSTTGSEHTIDGKQYDAEMHTIFYNSDDYASGTLAVASGDSDALAVFGLLISKGDENTYLDEAISATSEVIYEDEAYTLTASGEFDFEGLLGSIDATQFYRYIGGLTTPTCDEIITWTVFHKKITFSSAQLELFYDLMFSNSTETDDPMTDNFRPTQSLNSRSVYTSSTQLASAGASTVIICFPLIVAMIWNML